MVPKHGSLLTLTLNRKRSTNMRKLNAEQRVRAVLDAFPGGRFFSSARGVPLAVFGDKSVCWFAKSQHYRIFHGFGVRGPQKRFDYPDIHGVVGHFEGLTLTDPNAAHLSQQ